MAVLEALCVVEVFVNPGDVRCWRSPACPQPRVKPPAR